RNVEAASIQAFRWDIISKTFMHLPRWPVVLLLSALPAFAASSPARNLIVITIDTLRADHLGCYGYKQIRTPNIDALAGEGFRFEHAFAVVPVIAFPYDDFYRNLPDVQ